MKCPKCKRPGLRQQVSVFVECDAGRASLSKSGIRGKDVVVLGAGWPQACYICPQCGYYLRLGAPEPPKKSRRGK